MNFVRPIRADIPFELNMDHVISIRKEYEDNSGMISFYTVDGNRLFWRYIDNKEGCDADYNLLMNFISSKGNVDSNLI